MSARRPDLVSPRRAASFATLLLALFLALAAACLAHPAPFAVEQWWTHAVVAQRGDVPTSVALALNAVGSLPWSLVVVAVATFAVWRARVPAGVVTLLGR